MTDYLLADNFRIMTDHGGIIKEVDHAVNYLIARYLRASWEDELGPDCKVWIVPNFNEVGILKK